jgi:hypothetical protein
LKWFADLIFALHLLDDESLQVVFPKMSDILEAPQHCISWRFVKQFEPILMTLHQSDCLNSKPSRTQNCSASAELAFDTIMMLHKHILPHWLGIGEIIRVALSSAVASCLGSFRKISAFETNDEGPLKILLRTDDQEPVLVIVQSILSELCKIFDVSFGIVYPSTIFANRDSKFHNEDGGFATTLHLLRSGVILIPQIQELFSDTKASSCKIDILEIIGERVSQVPGTCIIGICCEHGSHDNKAKTANHVRLDRLWDVQFCCKASAKTETLLGFLESAVMKTGADSKDEISNCASEVHSKFTVKHQRHLFLQLSQDNSILRAYAQSVAMLTSTAAPASFSIVKRECNTKRLLRVMRSIQCANCETTNDGNCILACVLVFCSVMTLLKLSAEFG